MRSVLLLSLAVCLGVNGCMSSRQAAQVELDESGELAPTHCPDCGAVVVKVKTVRDDRKQPSKNICVWNRSICGNAYCGDDSVVCPSCWLAYSNWVGYWERSSVLRDSFHRPLVAAIYDLPLPGVRDVKSFVVYSQKIGQHAVEESVRFWCAESPEVLARFSEYAWAHGLSIRVEETGRIAGQVCVVVETDGEE